MPIEDTAPFTFDTVRRDELISVKEQREWISQSFPNRPFTTQCSSDIDGDLVGLGLSGGGVRSATFHLGVIQALATENLFSCFDYLSAVSGGSFITSWLAKWLLVQEDYTKVMTGLSPYSKSQYAKPIHRLRQYSSYLTPRIGPLGSDTLLFAVTYSHQLVLHLVVISLVGAFILLLPRIVLLILKGIYQTSWAMTAASLAGGVFALVPMFLLAHYYFAMRTPRDELPLKMQPVRMPMFVISVLIVVVSFFRELNNYGYYPMWLLATAVAAIIAILVHLYWVRPFAKPLLKYLRAIHLPHVGARHQTALVSEMVIGMGLINGMLIHIRRFAIGRLRWLLGILKRFGRTHQRELPVERRRQHLAASGLLAAFLLVLHFLKFATTVDPSTAHYPPIFEVASTWWGQITQAVRLFWYVGFSVIILISWLLMRQRFVTWMAETFLPKGDAAWFHVLKFSMAAMLSAILGIYLVFQMQDVIWHLTGFVHNRDDVQGTRDFPHVFILILPVCIIVGTPSFSAFIGILGRFITPHSREGMMRNSTLLYQYTFAWISMAGISVYGPIFLYAANRNQVIAFIAIIIASVISGVLARSPEQGSQKARYVLGLLELTSAYILVCCVLITLSWFISRELLGIRWEGPFFAAAWDSYWQSADKILRAPLLAITGGIAVLLVVIPARFGINQSSMHMFYRSRLAWAFLAEPLPGKGRLSVHDKTPVTYLDSLVVTKDSKYRGPYILVNAALNLVKVGELAWQERRAANFLFSPLFCGYEFPRQSSGSTNQGYQYTSTFTYGGQPRLTLAQAMTISGSALGTNMGFQTSPRVRFFNTLLNVRLGWWFSNPGYPNSWSGNIPRSRINMLWDEFMGKVDEKGPYVHLSDGGHFENLGLYELIRRRCRLVVISDASEDSRHHYHGLGSAIQRCRIDFGVEIIMNAKSLHFGRDRDPSPEIVMGEILYEPDNPEGRRGILVYLKPGLNTDLPIDVLASQQANPDFPNHTTFNQWFLESHFESYRALGYAIGREFALRLKMLPGQTDIHLQADALLQTQKLRPRGTPKTGQ